MRGWWACFAPFESPCFRVAHNNRVILVPCIWHDQSEKYFIYFSKSMKLSAAPKDQTEVKIFWRFLLLLPSYINILGWCSAGFAGG